ncbi:hypothetical protein ACJJTC_011893 [Scirpophaga incertulas]
MNGVIESGPSRPRPLSGGFWTLLSWLRGEEHASSNESVSSAGSDRTAISFAFLAPTQYHGSTAPIVLPLQEPPTDSYRKRIHDRNLRRQHDRDTTLRRKYGLFRGESVGFDVQTLPSSRLTVLDAEKSRERRATSECFQRRAAHVPGKRRAPLPPTRLDINTKRPSSVIIRQQTRKRPAPQPPKKLEGSKEIFLIQKQQYDCSQMNQNSRHKEPFSTNNATMGCKSEKYTKKENNNSKDGKIKPEKSFLKQIFETKKRNSSVETTTLKLLPNISELDKQAAEIIAISKARQTNKTTVQQNITETKNVEGQDKHATKSTTIYTQTANDIVGNFPETNTHGSTHMEDKQRLKQMLKEMKDSLPKRIKHNLQENTEGNHFKKDKETFDTPTLRIGCSSNKIDDKLSQQVQSPKVLPPNTDNNRPSADKPKVIGKNDVVHTPLKISSLLNPIYVPKINDATNVPLPNTSQLVYTRQVIDKKEIVEPIYVKTADAVREILLNASVPSAPKSVINLKKNQNATNTKISYGDINTPEVKQISSNNNIKVDTNLNALNIHARRRELVNQLEKSIATGNETSAAEAAAKLAQLRLTCSVLSFTSHILEQPSTSKESDKIFSCRTDEHSVVKAVSATSANENNKNNLEPSNKIDSVTTNINYKGNQSSSVANKVVCIKSDDLPQIQHTNIVSNSVKNITNMKCDVATQSMNNKKYISNNHPQPVQKHKNNNTTISIWVEDKEKAHGPITMTIRKQADVGELRRQAEETMGIPSRLQRWIIGKELCNNDNAPLQLIAGANLDSPFYLCLVECDKSLEEKIRNTCEKGITRSNIQRKPDEIASGSNVYTELVKLESQASVPNTEPFECDICMEECAKGEGVVLRECVHSFCRQCLSDVVRHCQEPAVSCPAIGCPGLLQEREIKALVNAEEYAKWLDRGLAAAESGTRNAFHCRTSDCSGWALCETGARVFPCPVCKHTNCVPCQAIHENETCDQYRKKLEEAANSNENQRDEGTQALIQSLISRGEALQCPECNAVITKKWGCDWVKCSACKTEICWVTRGRRWGPLGRGDTSGGCRCGVDGKRCHPSCGYCH